MAHVNTGGGVALVERAIGRCPTCEKRRSLVFVVPGNLYYAPTITCLGCGDRWSEGEMLMRPFAHGWRKDSIARARAQLERGGFCSTRKEYMKWVRKQFDQTKRIDR